MSRVKSGYTQKKYFKLNDGDSVFRILPPLEELGLAGKGKDWSQFFKVHYGYKNTAGKLRVFQSSLVINRKTKMVEVPDAADQRIKELKAKLEEAKALGNKAVAEKLGKLVSGQKSMYNVDSNHYVNAMDSQGNIGVLKLRHRAKKALEDQIIQLEKKNVDPLSINDGRFFTFRRSGTGLDTSFSVSVAQETLEIPNVGKVNRDIVHKLSADDIERAKSEAAELSKLFKSVSAEDIERIVKASDLMTGISPAIDEIFDSKPSEGGSDEEEDDSDSEYEAPARTGRTAQSASSTVAQEQVQETKAATEAVALNKAPEVVSTSVPQTTEAAVTDMSDAEFLKSLGI